MIFLPKKKDTSPKFNADRWRDHSANERTYLSWMRGSIALMGFGMVILRVRAGSDPVLDLGWILGGLFAIVGLITVVIATRHYFLIRRAIDDDTYEPARIWIACFSAAIALLAAGILYFVATSPDIDTIDLD
jgi:putative membrane protein